MTEKLNLVTLGETKNLPKLYQITNKINNKYYIGVTRHKLSKRFKEHCSSRSNCLHLKHALSKYGIKNFEIKLLVVGEEKYIADLEKKVILLYGANEREKGYNIKVGGKHPNTASTTAKERISQSLREYYLNNESKSKGLPSPNRKPVIINGSEYESIVTACREIGINYKTFLKIRSENLLHDTDEYFRLSKIKQYRPRATKKIRKSKSEAKTGENNPMFGKLNNHRSKKVEILGIMYPSISEAVRQTDMTKSMIEKRLQKGISGYKYVEDK